MNIESVTRISTRISLFKRSLDYQIGLNARKKIKTSERNCIYGKCITPALLEGTEVVVESTPKEDGSKEFEIAKQPNFMDDGDKAYIVLLNVFKYLSIKDILSAARVSKVWNVVSSDDSLWKTVSVKNRTITDCNGFAKSLENHGTQTLDISLICANKRKLCVALATVKTLRKIVFGYLPSDSLQTFAQNATQLTSLTAFVINPKLHLELLSYLKNLTELKLSGRMLSLCNKMIDEFRL